MLKELKDMYAARGASLYAMVKLSSDGSEATVENVSNQQTTGMAGLAEPGGLPTEGAGPTSGDQ